LFGIASSTAQESMLEYHCSQPSSQKVLRVFSDPKGLVFWNGGESSAPAIQLKAEGEPLPRKTKNTPTRAILSKAEEEPPSF